MSQEELEKAYNDAAMGTGKPALMMFNCPFCKQCHVLTPSKSDCCKAFIEWMESESKAQ